MWKWVNTLSLDLIELHSKEFWRSSLIIHYCKYFSSSTNKKSSLIQHLKYLLQKSLSQKSTIFNYTKSMIGSILVKFIWGLHFSSILPRLSITFVTTKNYLTNSHNYTPQSSNTLLYVINKYKIGIPRHIETAAPCEPARRNTTHTVHIISTPHWTVIIYQKEQLNQRIHNNYYYSIRTANTAVFN